LGGKTRKATSAATAHPRVPRTLRDRLQWRRRAWLVPIKKKTTRPALVRLAIVGAGGMANMHATNFRAIPGCETVAAVEPVADRRDEFCRKHGIPAGFAEVDAMLAAVEVDAVSIVAPDAFHAPLSIACLRAGKHVLCEKPLALDYAQARRMVAAARAAGTRNMVNFSYRNWPCLQAVAHLVQGGGIGDVYHVEASYLQSWLTNTVWGDWHDNPGWLWRLSSRHGSKGALGDIGVHIVDFATLPVGPIARVYARLKAFPKAPGNRMGEFVLDANDSAVLTVEFANGALGTIHTTRWSSGHLNRLFLKISGSRGAVEIDSERSANSYRVCAGKTLKSAQWREVAAKPVPSLYERFIASIRTGKPEQPDFARGAEIQRVLDACFTSNAAGGPVRVPAASDRCASEMQ
jgi:predicted dehydrogenase